MHSNFFPFLFIGLTSPLAGSDEETAGAKTSPPGFAIEHVSVIDVEKGNHRTDFTVLIEGPSIRKIGSATEIVIPEGFKRVDGKGRFLIPGLFDAHVHFVDPATYGPLCIAHGVTFVRDMGAFTEEILELRGQLNSGKKLGPEMICTGAIIDGKPPFWPFSEACETPDEGRAAVKKLVEAGVDQIKVYSILKRDVYLAIADEAKKHNIKFVGHVPESVPLEEAMQVGQYTDEHLMGFGAVIARLAGKPIPTAEGPLASDIAGMKAWTLLPEVERKALDEFTRRVADSGMVHCPTLIVHFGISRVNQPDAKNDPRMKFVSPRMKSFWDGALYRDFSAHLTGLEFMQQMVGELHRAGVPLIIGTDLANPNVFAGSSVHEEMALFAKSGIPPAEVLKAATIMPAHVCGVAGRLGTVSEGKTASLLLLRADPLENVNNVREVEAVFLRGQFFDRAHLDRLMEQAQKAAAESERRPIDIKVEVPGEIIARGVYRVSFNDMDAGTEEFAISRDADGYHCMSSSHPQGGWDAPSAVKLCYDAKFKPLSAEWHEFDDVKTVARYTVRDSKVDGAAVVDDKPAGEESFDMPEGAIFGGPAIAGDYFLYNAVALKPGEVREYQSITFGYKDWKLNALKVAMKRLDDAELSLKDGKPVRARRHSFSQEIPGLGPVTAETWSDERGVVLKSTMRLPFGTITWELE